MRHHYTRHPFFSNHILHGKKHRCLFPVFPVPWCRKGQLHWRKIHDLFPRPGNPRALRFHLNRATWEIHKFEEKLLKWMRISENIHSSSTISLFIINLQFECKPCEHYQKDMHQTGFLTLSASPWANVMMPAHLSSSHWSLQRCPAMSNPPNRSKYEWGMEAMSKLFHPTKLQYSRLIKIGFQYGCVSKHGTPKTCLSVSYYNHTV